MNQIKFYKNIFLVLPVLLLSGCEDFLSTEPDSTRATINTPAQVSQLLTTAYPQGGYVVFAESMSDNVEDKGRGEDDITNRASFLFQEVEATVEESDSPDMYWAECYRAISVANQALDIISKSDEPSRFTAQRGEALLARAYAHFMLVSYFSKFFDPQQANTDPGIPYVTEPETVVLKNYERKTVAYVYQMIEQDLLEGLPLISDGTYTVAKYHFNRAAANAFASRFYLVKRDYAKVLQYANEAFGGNSIADNLRPWNTTYAGLSPQELWNIYARANQNANLLLVETASTVGRYVAQYRYGMTYGKWLEISAAAGVINGSPRWSYPLYYQGDNNYFIPKLYEYFVRESVNADIGTAYVMLPIFTAEEVLFNRAEANAYLGNTAASLVDINLFVSKRVGNYDPSAHTVTSASMRRFFGTTNTRDGIINTILAFKRVEFVQEGMRWFDMQRYALPVTHQTVLGQAITVPATDPKRLLQIPQSATLAGIAQNPR
ncbi:RagB/SusD family nutrient uptake outer membrane protein [Dyadobacter chenwenxiniae]|uniref:RagB/SusD family nutrient uptake outer membrane protein n=1 Tax=Dyadobacter chenwenxiniae TaxID=2906456 RepID=A0A9X1PI50_9BACT|nr:RagB/SusD family nutrient uptake outer membrane protein [Dyadobacter chenwenxiniae]MCF0061111.1 RagB/SusD family nutrient uptake outer membrane protein [Dyadobacter chenwenxiniae]UON80938.1 RagB/SusD family nutrient uptake outer membrane protein [Dyadobacter chenwenxiniae]